MIPICPNCNKPIIGNLSPAGIASLPDAFCHCLVYVPSVANRHPTDETPNDKSTTAKEDKES